METGMDTIMMLSSGFAVVVGLFLDIMLLVVALTVVRRNRGDAMKWILASAIVGLVHGVTGPLAHWAASTFVGNMFGVDGMIVAHAATTFVSTIVSGLGFGLLILGIAKLARPPVEV